MLKELTSIVLGVISKRRCPNAQDKSLLWAQCNASQVLAKGNTHPAFTGVSAGEDEYRRSVTAIGKGVKEL